MRYTYVHDDYDHGSAADDNEDSDYDCYFLTENYIVSTSFGYNNSRVVINLIHIFLIFMTSGSVLQMIV